jgi:hypothetical protein
MIHTQHESQGLRNALCAVDGCIISFYFWCTSHGILVILFVHHMERAVQSRFCFLTPFTGNRDIRNFCIQIRAFWSVFFIVAEGLEITFCPELIIKAYLEKISKQKSCLYLTRLLISRSHIRVKMSISKTSKEAPSNRVQLPYPGNLATAIYCARKRS